MKKGFTLIELLVVVIIIGILASIAWPSYERAVETSRASEAVQMLKVLRDQQELCMLKHGGAADECTGKRGKGQGFFKQASAVLVGDPAPECRKRVCGPATKDFSYEMQDGYLYAYRRSERYPYFLNTTAAIPTDEVYNRVACQHATKGNKKDGQKVCEDIGATENYGGWNWFQ